MWNGRCELGMASGEFDLSYLAKVREGATGMIRIMLGGCASKSRNVRHSQSCNGGYRKSL